MILSGTKLFPPSAYRNGTLRVPYLDNFIAPFINKVLGQDLKYHFLPASELPITEDLFYLKEAYTDDVSNALRDGFNYDQFVYLGANVNLSFGRTFDDLNEYEIRALSNAMSDYIQNQNKQQQKVIEGLTNKFEQGSNGGFLNPIQRPNFTLD